MKKALIIILAVVVAAVAVGAMILIPREGTLAIDVSHHNRDVKSHIERFQPEILIAKATEGTNFKDSKFNHHRRLAADKNITFGAYHFLSFDKDAKKQFQNFLETVKSGSGDYKIQIKPILDVEDIPGKRKLSYGEMRRKVRKFGELCREEFGCYPIIYCSEGYRILYFLFGFNDYVFWTRNTATNPIFPSAMHQYLEDKHLNLDFNRVYDMSKIMLP